jgi:hypothetical protein
VVQNLYCITSLVSQIETGIGNESRGRI